MTNAKKAAIIAFINAALALAVAFNLAFTDVQQGAVSVFVNSALGLWVALTYKNSPMRIPEDSLVIGAGGEILHDDMDLREPMA